MRNSVNAFSNRTTNRPITWPECMESNSVLASQKSATMPWSEFDHSIHYSVAMNIAIVSGCMLKEDLKYSLIFGKYT